MFTLLKKIFRGLDKTLKYIEKHFLLWIFCIFVMIFLLKPTLFPNSKFGFFIHGTDNFYGLDTLNNAKVKGVFVQENKK